MTYENDDAEYILDQFRNIKYKYNLKTAPFRFRH